MPLGSLLPIRRSLMPTTPLDIFGGAYNCEWVVRSYGNTGKYDRVYAIGWSRVSNPPTLEGHLEALCKTTWHSASDIGRIAAAGPCSTGGGPGKKATNF